MGLIDNNGVVVQQLTVALDFGQKDAVGHEFDPGGSAGAIAESDPVAHQPLLTLPTLAQLLAQASGHGDGGDPPGLGAANLFLTTAPG